MTIFCLLFLLLLLIGGLFSSCSMQKRLYRPGYYVQKQNGAIQTDQVPRKVKQTSHARMPESIAENQQKDSIADPPVTTPLPGGVYAFTAEQPLKKVVPIAKQQEMRVNVSGQKALTKQNVEKKKQKAVHDAGGKSQLVALLLCIFLGWLGIHRFYLGYTGMGILYLFTFGILGIGWLIDIILLIIPNGLTPKGRTSYDQE